MSALANDVRSLTPARQRQRMRVALDAPADQVWALVGDLARLPEYSAGLERVDVKSDSQGMPVEFVCHFKPQQAGQAGLVLRDLLRWYEPGRGWASTGAEEVDAFGIRNSLHCVMVEHSGRGTLVTWVAHYDADDEGSLAAYGDSLDEAYSDIAARLIARFGGRVLERCADPGPA